MRENSQHILLTYFGHSIAWTCTKHRGITRVLNGGIKVGLDEIEKGFEMGVTAVLRLLLATFGDLVEEREDLFGCNGG